MTRRILATTLVLASAVLAGCGAGEFGGVYNMSLPGGADLGTHPYHVRVQFKDVLDLVPQAGVKVNDVAVGKVDRIEVAKDGWTAMVTVAVNGDVALPANAEARLRQSSLLGEKFVELAAPAEGRAHGELAEGAFIPLDRTNRNPEVEEVLGALSLLLNGGGVAQLQDITKELNTALSGNEPQIRSLLANLNTLVSGLDSHRGEITRALDGLNRLSSTLSGQRQRIGGVIDNLGPGLQVLAEQRTQLVTMLQSLGTLSGVAVDTVNKSKDDLVADLRALTPTLRKLSEAGANLPRAFQLLLTYPFPDSAVDGIKGDFTNLYATVDLNLGSILDNLARSQQNRPAGLTDGQRPGAPPLPLPTSPNTPPPGTQPTPSGGGLGGVLGSLLGGG